MTTSEMLHFVQHDKVSHCKIIERTVMLSASETSR
jgi:hypothetical protein